MSRRLSFSINGLQIVAAGKDALTDTNPLDFLFDSNLAAYIGLFSTGVVSTSAFSSGTAQLGYSTQGIAQCKQYTVSFGKTFASPPIVLCMFSDTSTDMISCYDYLSWYDTTSGGVTTVHSQETVVLWRSFTDHLLIEIDYMHANTSSLLGAPSTVSYFVAQK
jgi:hypothetical protein